MVKHNDVTCGMHCDWRAGDSEDACDWFTQVTRKMHVEGLIISRLASSGGYRLLSAYCPSFLCTRLCQNTVIRHHSCSVLTMVMLHAWCT